MITRYPLAERLANEISVDAGQDFAVVFAAAYGVLMSRDPSPGELEAAVAAKQPPPVPECGELGEVPELRWELS